MGSRLRACMGVLMLIAVFAGLPLAGSAWAAPRTVKVAVRNLEPFVITNDTGKSGFTVELWEEIAKRQGWSTEFVDAESVGAQLKDVAEGKADVGAGAISITADRRERFDFSQPIFNAGLQINAESWQATLEKLIKTTKFVGTYFGSVTRLNETATQRGIKYLKNVTGRETPLTTPHAS